MTTTHHHPINNIINNNDNINDYDDDGDDDDDDDQSVHTPNNPHLSVQKVPLFVPGLKDLASALETTLTPHFLNVSARVVRCPDLTSSEWGLAAEGLLGENKLYDVGGEHHQVKPYANRLAFGLEEVARAGNVTEAYFLGAGAAPRASVGCNGELIPIDNLYGNVRKSKLATVEIDSHGIPRAALQQYRSSKMGFLANLMSSHGDRGDVIEVRVSRRISTDPTCESFTDCMRRGLSETYRKSSNPVGLGGVFRVLNGQVRTHVMADTQGKVFTESAQVQEYLKMFTMGPDLVAATVFISDQPRSTTKSVRLEHTHLFHSSETTGGHYHGDVTPSEIEYLAYLVPNHELIIVDRIGE